MSTDGGVFRRNRTLIFFLLALIVVFGLLYALRSTILPFILGVVMAYLLLPLVDWAESKLAFKGRWAKVARPLLILLIFILALGVGGLFTFYLITAVSGSFAVLFQNAPDYVSKGLAMWKEWFETFHRSLSPAQQQQLDQEISGIGSKLGAAFQDAFVHGMKVIPGTFSMILGFAGLPLFLFYILKDSRELSASFYSFLTPGVARHARNILAIMDNVLGRYIRAQVIVGATVAVLVFTGLSILGIKLAPALAVVAGVFEFIPTIGPWLSGILGVVVALAIAPDKAIWVAVVYLAVQLSENLLLVPRVHGGFLRINPAILLVLLALGSYLAGIWGMILFPPLAALIVQVYRYVRQSVED
ncbi:MAG: AI-2E family transporter, partial [Chloroflexi bacterium]|nr:AI-2E family transporter [Chloroflexota bacterium]